MKLTTVPAAFAAPALYSVEGVPHLFLDTRKGGAWLFRYKDRSGRQRDLGIGSATGRRGPKISREHAVREAAKLNTMLEQRRDPLEERQKAKAATKSFGDACEAMVEARKAGWKNSERDARTWRNSLRTHCAAIWSKVVGEITSADIQRVLAPIWQAKQPTAVLLRGRIEAALDHAKAMGWRSGENPAVWRGSMKSVLARPVPLSQRGHHAALPYADMPAFMAALRGIREGDLAPCGKLKWTAHDARAAKALELLILTGARTMEVLRLPWDEVNPLLKQWRCPPERMKKNKGHTKVLSPSALAVLESIERIEGNPFVFPGTNEGAAMNKGAMLLLLRKMRVPKEYATVHGMRSAFMDYQRDQTDAAPETIREVLAHDTDDGVGKSYRRSEALRKRAGALAAWDEFAAGKVPLRDEIAA